MKLLLQSPKKTLRAFLKQKPLRSEIDLFKLNLVALLDKMYIIENRPKDESEEHLKNDIRDFLRDTYYRDNNAINTKDKKDLVIHLGKSTLSPVGVIVEAKRPANVSEMITPNNVNKKAFHELILYYLDERNQSANNQLKKLVITNINEWYIIDANHFDKHIFRNIAIRKLYDLYKADKKDTSFFYEEIRKIISNIDAEIPCTYFNIVDYTNILTNNNKKDDKELSALLKILSPQHLLKLSNPNDGNSLNDKFYKELLHIIGLEEAKDEGKTIIRRKIHPENKFSLVEITIDALHTEDVLHRIPDPSYYGESEEDRLFNVALELCITWINRILFLKLLEGQLENYHDGDKSYQFLNPEIVNDFDELFKLFHKVLAVNNPDRTEAVKLKYPKVPYLNSSLFEISELEDQTIKINSLDNSGAILMFSNSVLRDKRKNSASLQILDYLLQFLDAYDFASEGNDEVQEENKTIINASVLGKVFEKINGYKDGSIFTPSYITMYMCRKSIRSMVVQKFNEALSDNGDNHFDNFQDLRNYTRRLFKTSQILQANEIINSIKICDPAVGSGHFLVSAMNEIIQIKAELGILADVEGNSISNYEIEIINDELVITDPKDNFLAYKIRGNRPISKEIQHLQKTLFHEKQTIIENCLFGVDINQNSVKICRLRLWIELLKNAYYMEETNFSQLETLPNIDINIKCGNSLVSRFKLDADLSKALKNTKYSIKQYKDNVFRYKNEKNREIKRDIQKMINEIKSDFKTEINKNSKEYINWYNAKSELDRLTAQLSFISPTPKEKKRLKEKVDLLTKDIKKYAGILEEIKDNNLYRSAFEWRFEFPEVLRNDGEFEGFDLILGNPPYIQIQKLSEDNKIGLVRQHYETLAKTGDIYQLFYEQGVNLLKNKGQLAFITSNKWMRTDYGHSTRSYLSSRCNVVLVVDFGMKQIFDSATTYTNLLFLQRSDALHEIKMCRVNDDFTPTTSLGDYIESRSIDIENPGARSWICYEKNEYEVIKKIVQQGKALIDWDVKISYGLKTGLNDAFVIDTKTREHLIDQDPKSALLIKPLLRGEDIKAYRVKWANLWLIGTFPSLNLNIDDYPAIKNHLLRFKERLEPKPRKYDPKLGKWKGRKSGSYKWFETQDSLSYYQDFEKPKIIYPNMTKYMPFVYDKHQFFTNQKCFIITGPKLGYLAAFFNSKIFRFAFKDYFPELLGETRELSKTFFQTIPVKESNEAIDSLFNTWLEELEAIESVGHQADQIKKKIDEKFAELYSLSAVETELIFSSKHVDNEEESSISSLSDTVSP